ncbi:cytochrome b/b6 domain-containing protein [Microbacterium sp.]|uniref:cytochrome b/b6 domain-containing protein n=1 Tax=Microbacterium sp. TaxID=51671 RepID=UPI003F6EC4E1
MASYGQTLRRGLPRRPGGEPWPPAGDAPIDASDDRPAAEPAASAAETVAVASAPAPAVDPTPAGAPAAPANAAPAPVAATSTRAVRRGLPRIAGGEPWPAASSVAPAAAAVAPASTAEPVEAAAVVPPAPAPASAAAAAAPASTAPASTAPAEAAPSAGSALRRGLPRVAGGEPWPPAGFAPSAAIAEEVVVEAVSPHGADTVHPERPTEVAVPAASIDVSTPLPFTRTVWQGAAARRFEAEQRAGVKLETPEPQRYGPFTKLQWAGAVIVGGGGLLFAAGMAVLAVRWLLSTAWGVDFLTAYPGEYHLPEGAPVGFPAWLGWQHFFNAFLMVLIIRSGLQVRTEKRPTAFWTPRNKPKGKISLNLWFHQSLDILWLVNGVIFIVLLFVTGQWMRVIPTSWEVFPNAVSAILQYISLDWPTENGWVNYNAIQQIAYFVTIFIAAPVAAITGFRMSGLWPKNAKGLSKAYPIEWARAVHFPTMLYFVAFIAVHVFLVFATGALRNLNHMYAAQGSVDPNAYADNWTGFWFFVASLVVIIAAWIAARPLVLAPIARLFGNVSGR